MTARVTNGSLRGAYACEKRNLATVNTGCHWTVHGASQVLPLYQAPDKIARLSPPDVWGVTRPPQLPTPSLKWQVGWVVLRCCCRFLTRAGWKSLAMWFTLNHNQITLPGIPPARARPAVWVDGGTQRTKGAWTDATKKHKSGNTENKKTFV